MKNRGSVAMMSKAIDHHRAAMQMLGLVVLASMMVTASGFFDYDYNDDTIKGEDSCSGPVFHCVLGDQEGLEAVCVPQSMVCDGLPDCPDGKDELDCNSTCIMDEFRCGDGQCIGMDLRCDGEPDCLDFADEENCENHKVVDCNHDQMPCRNGMGCADLDDYCDGEFDCDDGSDEDMCPEFTCSGDELMCVNTTTCIPRNWFCDRQKDCDDGFDEENCITDEEIKNCQSFLCGDKSKCLEMDDLCDGHPDCLDGSDEANHCYDECDNLHCSFGCQPYNGGVKCSCGSGYILDPEDHKTCIDLDECAETRDGQPRCSQKCINTVGAFTCQCSQGYFEDQDTCIVTGPEPVLLFSSGTQIREYGLHGKTLKVVKKDLLSVADIDVEAHNRYLFWIDSEDKKVYFSSLKQARVPIVEVGLMRPTALSYDWQQGLLYIMDAFPGAVLACSPQERMCVDVVTGLQDRQPHDLLVDPVDKVLYWTELAHPVRIMRSDLDGRDAAVFLAALGMVSPNHLTLDQPTGALYWVDSGMDAIYRLPTHSPENQRVLLMEVVISYDVHHPTWVGIVEDTIVWTEKRNRHVMAANKFSGKDRRKLLQHSSQITAAVILHPALQPKLLGEESPCKHSKCKKMCIESNNHQGYTCLCPPQMELQRDGFTCLWSRTYPYLVVGTQGALLQIPPYNVGSLNVRTLTATGLGSVVSLQANPRTLEIVFIHRGNQGGPLQLCSSVSIWLQEFSFKVIEERIETPGEAHSLAVDWAANQIFWLNAPKKRVDILQVEGSSRSHLTIDTAGEIRSMAINVTEGMLFYSQWGKQPQIVRCRMDGTQCAVLVSSVQKPDHLVSYGNRLYWSDMVLGHISSVFLNGSDKASHVGSAFPQHFAVHNGSVFYSDNMTQSIQQFDPELKTVLTQFRLPHHPVLSLAMLSPVAEVPDVECAMNNGHCSDVCLSLPDAGYLCLCPPDFTLNVDQHTCDGIKSKTEKVESVVSSDHCRAGSGCQHLCTMTPAGPQCSCDFGMTLTSDNRTCTDIDECAENNGECSQFCRNTQGSYLCTCADGYSLVGGDKQMCYSEGRELAYLLVSTTRGIFKVEMRGQGPSSFVLNAVLPTTFDVFPVWVAHDFQEDQLVWVAPSSDKSSSSSSSTVYTERKGSRVQKVTVDTRVTVLRVCSVTRNVYYVSHDAGSYALTVCDQHIANCSTVLANNLWRPVSLAFHSSTRMMYWVDATKSTIDGAYMDGTGSRQVVAGVTSGSDLLALDPVRQRFFWVEPAVSSVVWTARLDGTDRAQIGKFPRHLIQSMVLFEGFLYLTEKNTKAILKVSTFSSRPVLAEIFEMKSDTQALRLAHPGFKVDSPCLSMHCPYLCVLSRLGAVCACPDILTRNNPLFNCDEQGSTTTQPTTPTTTTTLSPLSASSSTSLTTTSTTSLTTKTSTTTTSTTPATTTGRYSTKAAVWVKGEDIIEQALEDALCHHDSCLNGGTCYNVAHSLFPYAQCSCLTGFSGARCDVAQESASPASSSSTTAMPGGTKVSSTKGKEVTAGEEGSDGPMVAGIIVGVMLMVIVVLGLVCFLMKYKLSLRGKRLTVVGYKVRDDLAALVPANSISDDFMYCKWDLDGNLLNSSTDSSTDSAVYSTHDSPSTPIVRPSTPIVRPSSSGS